MAYTTGSTYFSSISICDSDRRSTSRECRVIVERTNGKLYKRVANGICEAIDSGEFPVGSRLPTERELTERFDVSRPTVREAVIALEMRGIVEARRNLGIFVAEPPEPSSNELDIGAFELAEARRLIEGETAALAATMIGTTELAQLDGALTGMADENKDTAEAADREFHMVIARATGNGALINTVNNLWDARERSPLARHIFEAARDHSLAPQIEEHRAIVAALRDHDPAAARTAMREHLDRVIDHLLHATERKEFEHAQLQAKERRDRIARRAV